MIRLALALIAFGLSIPLVAVAAPRPNVVLVMSDDQGWGDAGYQGHPHVRTPNLDALAREGIRFDRFYAAAPSCSPTRGSVLTGRTPNRYGCFSWGHTLRPQEITIAEVLRTAGYRTGLFGKWHVGSVQQGSPVNPGAMGFDEWVCSPNFFDFNPVLSVGGRAVPFRGESSELTADLAIEFIRRCADERQPFFTVVWFSAPHVPHEATPKDRALYPDVGDDVQHFYGEITAMDRAFGRLRRALRELDVHENTVLWFCSDNGALPGVGSTGGRRASKEHIYDGGLLVPALLEWPAEFPEPKVIATPGVTSDIFPTLLELAGVNEPPARPLDGVSLLPMLRGETAQRTPIGFWQHVEPGVRTPAKEWMAEILAAQARGEEPTASGPLARGAGEIGPPAPLDRFPGHAAWLDWPWKLHRIEDSGTGQVTWELYNLAADPAETNPLVDPEDNRTPAMQRALENWLSGVVASLNGGDYPAPGGRLAVDFTPLPMRNLLHDAIARSEITDILVDVPRRPLLPAIGDRAWAAALKKPAVRKWMEELRPRAEREAHEPLPELTAELYGEFHRTGARASFERVYSERRRRLARAVVALLVAEEPERERLARSVVAKTRAILAEPSWAFPAHVSHVSGQDASVIDLVAAETADMMAEILNLCGDRIPSDLAAGVRWRLRSMFENYVENHARFLWTGAGMNWNAVCHQGIIGAALAIEEDNELLTQMLWLARGSLPKFLSGFGRDGSTSEGPEYWAYGFGRYAWLNQQLEARTGGRLSLLHGDKHAAAVARFGPQMTLSNFHFVNFSDCRPSGVLDPALLAYLGERYSDPVLAGCAAEGYRRIEETGIGWDEHRLFPLLRLLLYRPAELIGGVRADRPDVFIDGLGALILHGADAKGNYWEFAAKGGNNHEHHNHNDCGTYLLNIDGVRLVTEIGMPEYVRDYFTHKRYEFLAARSRGHSVPLVNSAEQPAGSQYVAKVLACEVSKDAARFVLDLTAAYPAEAGCTRLVRTFEFDRRAGRLRVTDEYELERGEAFESAVMSEAAVHRGGAGVVLSADGRRLAVTPLPGSVIAEIEPLAFRAKSGVDQTTHRIVVRPEQLARRGSIGVEFRIP